MILHTLPTALGACLFFANPIWVSTFTSAEVTINNYMESGVDEPEESSTESDEPKSLPSLDELLGIDDDDGSTDEQALEDPNDAELDRVLSPQQAGQAFTQAIGLMDQVAARIENQDDLSIATQRLQEDILRKLDQVIESAEQNQSGGGGQSSSSEQSSGSNEDQPDQQQQEQAPGQGSESSSESGDTSMPAGSSDANPGDEIQLDGVRWGSLPKRIRDALSQGIADEYSELYRSVTERYFRALADDEE
jgi:hypothetical protein